MYRVYESETITDEYIKYRPKYSNEARDVIIEYLLKEKSDRDIKCELMVEVGCGSGQATNLFAPYFNRVYATDISEAQIERAQRQNKFTNVVYKIGCAEELVGVENQSVDLLLAATCAHWFDLPRFFAEASRVLKPEGCLVLLVYPGPALIPHVKKKELPSNYFGDLYYYYQCRGNLHNLNIYKEIADGYNNMFEAIPGHRKERKTVQIVYEDFSLTSAKGLMRTSDAYQSYMEHLRKVHGGQLSDEQLAELDSVELFANKVKSSLDVQEGSDDDILFRAVYDVYVLLSKPF